jgi:hypothetical protein
VFASEGAGPGFVLSAVADGGEPPGELALVSMVAAPAAAAALSLSFDSFDSA